MGLHLKQNQYRGVNAHLHSRFQQRGGWDSFHHDYMHALKAYIEGLFPSDADYSVSVERSIQLALHDMFAGDATTWNSNIAVRVYDERGIQNLAVHQAALSKPSMVLPLTNLFIDRDDIISVVIYQKSTQNMVARIELLSPASKPEGSHHQQYLVRRSETLQKQIKLIELDFLHERRSVVYGMPDYTQFHEGAYPYSILVSELISVVGPGQTDVYAFRVEDPIPTIAVPLCADDVLGVDFGNVYHRTFFSNSMYGLRYVDYEKLPDGFETYDETDQTRIKMRMRLVATMRGVEQEDEDAEWT